MEYIRDGVCKIAQTKGIRMKWKTANGKWQIKIVCWCHLPSVISHFPFSIVNAVPSANLKNYSKYRAPRGRNPIYWLILCLMEYKRAKRYISKVKAGAAKGFRPIKEYNIKRRSDPMPGGKKAEEETNNKKYSRRDFLVTGGTVVAVDALISSAPAIAAPKTSPAAKIDTKINIPVSKGYLVYDSKKCAGCTTCMLACSLTHYGVQNLSLARIQIIQDSFGKFPDDLKMAPCRQCATPPCVINCPVGAAYVDEKNGNVRRIDQKKCIGCKTCIKMCPQQPHRTVWNHIINKSSKCDLCIDTAEYWKEKGGPGGKQACVESCPMKAIKFVAEMPDQTETHGYDVKLRNEHWFKLGLYDEDKPTSSSAGGFGGGAPKAKMPAAPTTPAAKPKE
jgi:protein NrfC